MSDVTRRTVLTATGGSALGVIAESATPAAAAPSTPATSATASTAPAARTTTPAASSDRRPRGGPVPEPPKASEAVGYGGAVSCVDPYAAQVGIDILRHGGNATDAAIAMAATLGVTEPYSCGLGGGGFFVHHDARSGRTVTINGRESAPATYTEKTFTDAVGEPLDFDEVVNSGLSVGVPGTLATWDVAARRFGRRRLADLLRPAEEIARRGFVVDAYYRSHTADNAERFARFPETARVYLPGGAVPEVGDVMRNPDLADTYARIRWHGVRDFYRGRIARAIVDEARRPSTAAGVDVFPGQLTLADLRRYRARTEHPTRTRYRDLEVLGMGVPSSGGIAVGQILLLIEAFERRTGKRVADLPEAEYLHWFSEASALAFADRNRYVADVRGVPQRALLSRSYADERAELFDPDVAAERPVPFGAPGRGGDGGGRGRHHREPHPGRSTTHLNVTDRWGDVVSYTLTIEQTGGSGITVPGHGFLLNNELTDFEFEPLTDGVPHPNLPGPGKQPRSSMSPTIVLERGRPVLSAGTPGGSTIITSVAQILLGHLDRGLDLVDAIAAPRLSSRNGTATADLGLAESPVGAALRVKGHELSSTRWIGNASGIALERGHGRGRRWGRPRLVAAAETERGDGGAARVLTRRHR